MNPQFTSEKKFTASEVDIWMIRDNLQLSYEERVIQYQNTLDFIDRLKQEVKNVKPSEASKITDP